MNNMNISFMPKNPILAHAYVPFQIWNDNLFDYERGLKCGTIFPELSQPMELYEWGNMS